MNCFEHHAGTAIAAFGICGRGVCTACAVEVERFIVCRGRCEESGRLFGGMTWGLGGQQRQAQYLSLGMGMLTLAWGLFANDALMILFGGSLTVFSGVDGLWIRHNLVRRR